MQRDDGRIALDLVEDAAFSRMPGDGGTLVVRVGAAEGAGDNGGGLDVVGVPAITPFAHGAGCVCCAPDGAIAAVLADLFRARVTGRRPWFDRVMVVVPAALHAGMRQALEGNNVVAARYRPVWRR
ncbi:hypothetical protein [Gluconacetobacter diazotrophicus]|uniref:hypothetical protein n=1 Tax=Gluconacetobacter diazotrophicus TaxID=33996 RepID=UPI00119A12DB|nr:hypothetical protein [Gluconacetobacter diazotrophicus]TWB06020.1 hypothetical protein FBZ86_1138 [Gluconacetobacter diazotrophicus]